MYIALLRACLLKGGIVFFVGLGLFMGAARSAEAAGGSFGGGSGTVPAPYLVEDCSDLQAINGNLSAHYRLTQDIDCSATVGWNAGAGFQPIGGVGFSGSINGDGFVVSDLTINRSGSPYVGFVSSLEAAGSISNIGFVDAQVTASSYSGVVVGDLQGTVSHVFAVGGSISCPGAAYCGGLVGWASDLPAVITDSYSNLSVSATAYEAGIIGRFSTGTIENVYAAGAVTGLQKYGIVGSVDMGVTPTVTNAYYDQTTTGAGNNSLGTPKTTAEMMTEGTFIGWDFTVAGNGAIGDWVMAGYPHLQMEHRETITSAVELQLMKIDLDGDYTLASDISCACSGWNGGAGFNPVGSSGSKFTGSLDGNGNVISDLRINRTGATNVGLFGYVGSGGIVTEVGLEDLVVSSLTYSGGLVGVSEGTVSKSYTTGFVTSTGQAIGGLVGHNNGGTVSNSYSFAAVSSTLDVEVGGLVGWNDEGVVTNSYSTGLVNNGVEAHTGMDAVGGLIGFSFGGSVTNSFWDMDASGQDFSWAGTGKTTVQMSAVATFTDTDTVGLASSWDFYNNPNDDVGVTDIWHIHASANGGYPFLAWQALVETTRPTITSVNSDKANGHYGVGEVIDIDLTFSEAVTSTGAVTVTLETGTTDRTCTVTVTGSASASCTYTVQAGDASNDLTVSSISGTIVDGYGNTMTSFVPATNLAANKAIVIDTTAPILTLLGSEVVTQFQFQTYTDAGVTATDAVEGDVQARVSVTGSVNTQTPGTYVITYSVSDSIGNAASNRERRVVVTAVGGGGASAAPGGAGSGAGDREVGMSEAKDIGELSEEGINLLTYIGGRAFFRVRESRAGNAAPHSVTIANVDLSGTPAVTIILASTPQTSTLRLGDSLQADLDGDGTHDLNVTFAQVWVNRVELTLKALHMALPQSAEQVIAPVVTVAEAKTASLICPSPLFVNDLQMGSSSESVRVLQRYLNEKGFFVARSGVGSKGKETGYFGSMTKAALLKFQSSVRLKMSGAFDLETRTFLGCVTANPPSAQRLPLFTRDLALGAVGEDVRELQRYLNAQGFIVTTSGLGAPGKESDVFGPRTLVAVKRFQQARKILPANGFVGALTRASMVSTQ